MNVVSSEGYTFERSGVLFGRPSDGRSKEQLFCIRPGQLVEILHLHSS